MKMKKLTFDQLRKKCPSVIELQDHYHKTIDDLIYQCRHELDLREESQDACRLNARQARACENFIKLCVFNGGVDL